MGWAREHRGLVWVLAAQALAALVFAFTRVVDADEGFYLAAAQRVSDGLVPHVDFFYPQSPLFPMIFAPLGGWGMESLQLLRVLAVLASLGLTTLCYRFVTKTSGNREVAVVTAALVAINGLALTWHSVFKPYAFIDVLIFAAFYLTFVRGDEKPGSGRVFWIMALTALAANLRSVMLVLLPVFLYYLVTRGRKQGASTGKLTVAAIAGIALPTLPALWIAISAPTQFFFNNLGFHLQREPIEPFSALVLHKLTVLGKFLALPQTILLLGAALASWLLIRQKLERAPDWLKPAGVVALVLMLVYLVPTPVHLQYFQQTIPYLALLAVPCAAFVLREGKLRLILRSAGMLYLVGLLPFVVLFILSPREQDQRFEWTQLKTVVGKIESQSQPNDTVLSEWAGYAALAMRPQLPGSEHVGFHFPLKISASEFEQMHLLTTAAINSVLAARRPELIIVDYQVYPEWREALAANYHAADSSERTYIYKRNAASL